MLTEILSGKCPCCGYDKLLQRYGSMGYYQLDGCPKCGFGYGSNHHDEDSFGTSAWLDYGVHVLAMVKKGENKEEYNKLKEELNTLSDVEKRKLIFEWAEGEERSDDVATTVFVYSEEDVKSHMSTNPVIF